MKDEIQHNFINFYSALITLSAIIEVNAFLYKTESINKLVNDYMEDLEYSNLLSIEKFNKRLFRNRVLESTCRLLSPMP